MLVMQVGKYQGLILQKPLDMLILFLLLSITRQYLQSYLYRHIDMLSLPHLNRASVVEHAHQLIVSQSLTSAQPQI
jgi:hypothetical protein